MLLTLCATRDIIELKILKYVINFKGVKNLEIAENIYEPLHLFEMEFKESHKKNVSDYFENLVKKSGVKEEENVETVKKIRKKEEEIAQANKKVNKFKTIRGLLVFLTVLCFIGTIVFFYFAFGSENPFLPLFANILIAVAFVLIGVFVIVMIVTKTNKVIKTIDKQIAALNAQLSPLMSEAWKQMEPLNSLYDWGMTAEIVEKTIPLVKMDRYFDSRRFDYLNRKYGLEDNSNPNNAVMFVQSGEMVGNPFLLARKLNFHMGSKDYRGTLQISWTETYYVDGRAQTRLRTQTLEAILTKPYPEYANEDVLIYGNDAAPDLSFSRTPSNANSLNEKQIDKLAEKESKKIEKMSRESITKGGSFTAMGNDEFDGLFKAIDRNNEVQFRLLFTPLAQKQIVDLIKDKTVGYGDDFSFYKRKCLNYIYPRHIVGQDIYANPNKYVSYDIGESRRIFNGYNNTFFKQFYFAMAPVLSIPLYQQFKPAEFIYKDTYPSYISCWEHESLAYSLNINNLKHPESITNNILKTTVLRSQNGTDQIKVSAHGFKGIEHVDYVSKLGGDGRMHNVPVHWTEYIPVNKDSSVAVKVADKLARPDFLKNINGNVNWGNFFKATSGNSSNVVFRRSLMALYINNKFDESDTKALDDLLANSDKIKN